MLTLRQERQMHKEDWLYHMQYVSSVPTPFSFTCSWWSPPGSSLQLSVKGRRGMHLAGEMGVSTCWNFSNRAVLLGISLTQNNSVSDLQQVPFFPGQCALCSLCPILWQALPSPPRASLPAATGRQGGRVHHQKPLCASSLSPGHYPEQCFSRVSLATTVLSGNSPKLTMLDLTPVQNQYNSKLHFKLLAAKPILLGFPHYPLSAAVDYN